MSSSKSLSQQQQSSQKDKFQIKVVMTYAEIAGLCEQLGYRDKLRLAQLLIQLARKEEETQNPQSRIESKPPALSKHQNTPEIVQNSQSRTESKSQDLWKPQSKSEIVQYVFERIIKLKPSQKKSLKNSIRAMFQFQGGISDAEQEKIIAELQKLKYIQIDKNNRVKYL